MGNLKSKPIVGFRHSFLRIACSFITGCMLATGWTWNATGHRVVAEIAWRDLKPEVKKKLSGYLTPSEQSPALSLSSLSTWADENRTDQSSSWHYINLHFRADGKPSSNKPARENVVWAIEKFSAILKHPSTSSSEKLEALRYLVHFVADVHQPLHCVARDTDAYPKGDLGGNRFLIGSSGLSPEPKNLHAFWDMGGGLLTTASRSSNTGYRDAVKELANKLLKEAPPSAASLKKTDPMSWAQEGLALAQSQVYNLPENSEISDDYKEQCRKVTAQRIVLAGKRLAILLNKLVK